MNYPGAIAFHRTQKKIYELKLHIITDNADQDPEY